jgi:hypothetical protein
LSASPGSRQQWPAELLQLLTLFLPGFGIEHGYPRSVPTQVRAGNDPNPKGDALRLAEEYCPPPCVPPCGLLVDMRSLHASHLRRTGLAVPGDHKGGAKRRFVNLSGTYQDYDQTGRPLIDLPRKTRTSYPEARPCASG